MPWSSSEANSHTKKATTPAKKKKWASIANGVRKASGGDDGKAIRIANAAVDSKFWKGNLFLSDKFKKFLADGGPGSGPQGGQHKANEEAKKAGAKSYKGIYYFPSRASALAHARNYGLPTDRIIEYECGHAIQNGKSGSYVGPNNHSPKPWPSSDSINASDGDCDDCGGSGMQDGNECPACGGSGKDQSDDDDDNMEDALRTKANDDSDGDCPDCDGTGIDENGDECETCHGTGNISMEDDDEGSDMSDSRRTRDGKTLIRMYDKIEVDDGSKVRFLDNGYLSAMPRIARTGVQIYGGSECGMPEMDIVRVYRPADEVFNVDAAHTYTHLPLTLDHPTVQVDSSNWKKYAVGETGDEVLRDGNAVRVPMMLRDAKAIEAFRQGVNQLSVGYDCAMEWTEGVTDTGEKYDAIQRGIRANHLAIVTAARGGSALTIGDGDDNEDVVYFDQQGAKIMNERILNVKTILVDGLEVQVLDSAAPVIQRAMSALELRFQNLQDDHKKLNDEFKKKVKEGEDDDEEMEKKDAALKAKDKALETKDGEISTLKKQLEDAIAAASPQAVDKAARERSAVIDKANTIMGARQKTDGMTVAEIRRAVVDAKIGNCKDWSDDRISGAFEAMQSNAFADRRAAPTNTMEDAVRIFSGRPGGGYMSPQDLRDKAYNDYDSELSNQWRGKQTV